MRGGSRGRLRRRRRLRLPARVGRGAPQMGASCEGLRLRRGSFHLSTSRSAGRRTLKSTDTATASKPPLRLPSHHGIILGMTPKRQCLQLPWPLRPRAKQTKGRPLRRRPSPPRSTSASLLFSHTWSTLSENLFRSPAPRSLPDRHALLSRLPRLSFLSLDQVQNLPLYLFTSLRMHLVLFQTCD